MYLSEFIEKIFNYYMDNVSGGNKDKDVETKNTKNDSEVDDTK